MNNFDEFQFGRGKSSFLAFYSYIVEIGSERRKKQKDYFVKIIEKSPMADYLLIKKIKPF